MDTGIGFGALGIGLTVLCIVISTVVPILVTIFILKRVSAAGQAQAAARQLMMTRGVAAQAKITSVGAGGMTVSRGARRSVQLSVTLEVTVDPAAGPYEVQLQTMVPEIAMAGLQPGATVPVRVDPDNAQNVMIDLGSMGYQV